MSWFADRGGFGAEFHSTRCLAVDLYEQQYDHVETIEDCPNADPLIECLLCEHEIVPGAERYAPLARELAPTLTPTAFELEDCSRTSRHFDPLRTIGSYTEAQLVDEGYLAENTGVEVRSRRDWKDTHGDVADSALFEFLLRDAVEVHLVFYREYKDYDDEEAFIEDTLEASGTTAGGSAPNIVGTWEWLQTLGVPDTLDSRQASFATFISE
ncbi:hypothetical protein [Saliphagus sp. LR7]|uniref:hypothetical protein n=1 Tax=Saliphagus sp. LR7 TaxID=2282654 RepID=UPI00130023C4|nr:hypothetical protein [Saliphagus sp. LR7]